MTGIIGRLRRACVGVCLLAVASGAARGAEMAFVEVGDPGNTANIVSGYPAGGVSGMYKIGTYEVTNAQYVEFLNAVDPDLLNHYNLYNPLMKTDDRVGGINIVTFVSPDSVQTKYAVKAGRGNLPVTYVSFYDALRFINWMNNGKGNANTEAGAYTLKGTQPTPDQQNDIVRNAGATYFMPNDDEWYKAAYYKGGGTDAGYWKYATSSDTMPKSETPGYKGSPNSANYFNNGNDFADGYNNGYALTRSATLQDNLLYLSDVGGYTGSVGPYGTFDQNGNAYEWDETLSVTLRSIRGGGFNSVYTTLPSSYYGAALDPTKDYFDVGFRVGTVPEPVGVLAAGGRCGDVAAAAGRLIRGGLGRGEAVPAVWKKSVFSVDPVLAVGYDVWKEFGLRSRPSGCGVGADMFWWKARGRPGSDLFVRA